MPLSDLEAYKRSAHLNAEIAEGYRQDLIEFAEWVMRWMSNPVWEELVSRCDEALTKADGKGPQWL